MKYKKLTAIQFDRFKVIDRFMARKGRLPTNFEVMKMFGQRSTSASHLTLQRYFEHKSKVEQKQKQ
jgi:hypothetical protein